MTHSWRTENTVLEPRRERLAWNRAPSDSAIPERQEARVSQRHRVRGAAAAGSPEGLLEDGFSKAQNVGRRDRAGPGFRAALELGARAELKTREL